MGVGHTVGVNKVSSKDNYKETPEGTVDFNVKLGELRKLPSKDLIL